MLRKKWQVHALTLSLVAGLLTQNAAAMDWPRSREAVTDIASAGAWNLLSYPGSALMWLGGYTGVNNLLGRIAPERWLHMDLQSQQAIVGLVAALVGAIMAIAWKFQPSDTSQVDGSSSGEISEEEQLELYKKETGALRQSIDELEKEIRSLVNKLSLIDVQRVKEQINALLERINRLKDLIQDQTSVSVGLDNVLNEQLMRLKTLSKDILNHNTSLIELELKAHAISSKRVPFEVINTLAGNLREQGSLIEFLDQDAAKEFSEYYDQVSRQFKGFIKGVPKEIESFIDKTKKKLSGESVLSTEERAALNIKIDNYFKVVQKYIPAEKKESLYQALRDLQYELSEQIVR